MKIVFFVYNIFQLYRIMIFITLTFKIKSMIDLKIVRQKPGLVKDSIEKRNMKINLDEFLKIDKKRSDLISKLDELREERNKVSKQIPNLSIEEKSTKIAEMKELWCEIKLLEGEFKEIEQKFNYIYYRLPNFLDDTAIIWKDDSQNKVESYFLEPTNFDFKPRTHYEIGEDKNWIDIPKASEVSGSRFCYIKWDLALLNMAIINYAIDFLVKNWFEFFIPPVLVREKSLFGTWFLPVWEDGLYAVNPWEDDLYLIWTSEISLTSYHIWEILDLEKPLRYIWYSLCFRKEAWSYGKDTKWILRWHQFEKVEMVCFCKPEDSFKIHNEMVELEESIWQSMKLPYQKVNLCSGDLRSSAMKTYDLEAWLPWEGKYREVTSCSNVWDFQSRRLWIKYNNNDSNEFVHTLNGTVVALSRCLIAIIENYQTKDWDVLIPDILKSYMWWKDKI